ncbi:MAG: phage portal protein [Nitrospinae bacterium]|nr:phage portal protein [Nitrospinota bacterium]
MFWRKEKDEKRSYTDAEILRQLRDAEGDVDADPNSTSAAQTAAAFIGRCLALAEVSPAIVKPALGPDVLYDIGRDLILAGESVHAIDVTDGKLALWRTADHDVMGDPENWRYRITISGPTGDKQLSLTGDSVFHPRLNVNPSQPHKGRSPIECGGYTSNLAANLERSLEDETGGSVGHVLPAPLSELDPALVEKLRADLKALKGATALVETLSAGLGDGRSGAPAGDWQPRRIGADPPQSLLQLRAQAYESILSVCGVSPILFSTGADASAAREALRQFLHSTLQPIGDIVAAEARRKLHPETKFDFSRLMAADVQGKARAAKSLVDAGFTLEQAAIMTGFREGGD